MGRPLLALFVAVVLLAVAAGETQPRSNDGPGGGVPPAAIKAPSAASPMAPYLPAPVGTRTNSLAATGIGSALYNQPGVIGGLFAGFLGAGVFGLLFGHGLFGGLGNVASVFGLFAQILILFYAARAIWALAHRRRTLIPVAAEGPILRDVSNPHADATAPAESVRAAADAPLTIIKPDYDDFERLLYEVSNAYGAEDLAPMRSRVTPAMLEFFAERLARNASHGVINRISGLKLLQADLEKAWREGEADYAMLAMRYAITDKAVERTTGNVIEGSDEPHEVTEAWTFVRQRNGRWILSSIA